MQTVSPKRLLTLRSSRSLRLLTPALAIVVGLVVFQIWDQSWQAQSTTTVESRDTPAPWRPSFGKINSEAAEAQSNAAFDLSNPANSSSGSGSDTKQNPLNLFNNQPQLPDRSPLEPAGPDEKLARQDNDANKGNQSDNAAETVPALKASADQQKSRFGPTIKPGVTRVTKTLEKLPNSAGQVWREYNISPYTSKITNSEDPQKAITEWILRETGTEMWFAEPLGILHANKEHLYVYHTPEIHRVVKGIVDRFVLTRGQIQNIDVNLVTIEKPNWRSQAYTMLQPIDVKSPGVEAWVVSKENAAILLSQLSRRGDFKQHSGGRLTNHDGQAFVLGKTKPVQFVRSLQWVPNQVPNYQPLLTSVDEGYQLSISSLSCLDHGSIEAIIKCECDQVERLSTVKVNVPGGNAGSETINLQIPQLASWRVHERFRWANDQVLLLSCGVVASPEPESKGGLRSRIQKLNRADALLFIEYRGPATGPSIGARAPLTAQNRITPLPENRR